MTKKYTEYIFPKEVTEEFYKVLVADAQRIMGLRMTTVKHGKAPVFLTPPLNGHPWAEHILGLTCPIVNIAPGWYANKVETND